MLFRFGLDILKQNARLYAQRALFFVIPKDLVHALDGQNNAALYGDGSTDLTGARSAYRYRHVVFAAQFQRCRNFLGTFGLHDRLRCKIPAGILVMAVVCSYRIAGVDCYSIY